LGVSTDEIIVDIGRNNDFFIGRDVNAFISFRGSKTESHQLVLLIVGIKVASLFKAIKSFVDFEDTVFTRKVRNLESLNVFLFDKIGVRRRVSQPPILYTSIPRNQFPY